MRRSDIAITPNLDTVADRQAPKTVWASANAATTSKNHRAGGSAAGNDESGVHTAEFVTPTKHRYRSMAPPLPGLPDIEMTKLEVRIGIAMAKNAA